MPWQPPVSTLSCLSVDQQQLRTLQAVQSGKLSAEVLEKIEAKRLAALAVKEEKVSAVGNSPWCIG